jgi:23S rRNA (adenine2503-C2)-methyltransferase
VAKIVNDQDGRWNRRFAVELADGATVETVLYRGDTLCVSCQVGCAVRCPFCASGARGLGRSLSAEEMDAQVSIVTELLAREGAAPLRGVTVSGIGEPLHNHAMVAAFVDGWRARGLRATLTTSGGPLARLREWVRDRPHNGLTISVHAGTEEVRARVVPHGPELASLFSLLEGELPTLTRARRKKTALAYLLLASVNDSNAEVDAFIARALPLGVFVHLYAYNPVASSDMQGVDRARYEAVYQRMTDAGLTVRMSARARIEANGGCGTLVALRPELR